MASLSSKLPPLNSLVAFEAAARHLSFTRAAEELLVSREAVSRHIRNLEGHLGTALFRRLHRALELTAAGNAFRPVVRASLENIARGARALQGGGHPSRITVTATVAIASFWLTPRLPRFRSRHPEAEIRMVIADREVDMAAEEIDVGLRYGDGGWPGLAATRLFDIDSFPVCAPGYLDDSAPLEVPGDLLRQTLLNLDGTAHSTEDWTWWLAGAGVSLPASFRMLGFDNYANVIQAAMDGQGVALGFSHIVSEQLARGQLVRPLAHSLSKGYAVYLVVPEGASLSPNAQNFFDWIVAEAAIQTG